MRSGRERHETIARPGAGARAKRTAPAMTTDLAAGFALVLAAGVLQGSFVLPMTLTREWKWEHTWLLFSLFGMLVFNWLIAALVIPNVAEVFRSAPSSDLIALAAFGGLWGLGAILFGLGMDRLGMALGYPVIMGLILSLGALIPLLIMNPAGILSVPGLVLLIGTAVTIGGIILCSSAAGLKGQASETAGARAGLAAGLMIAILAGVFSCFPNVGMNYAEKLRRAALDRGASDTMAGNAAWALLFTAGFLMNAVYCGGCILRRRTAGLFARRAGRNLTLIAAMGLSWIGSFYLYGMGAARLGRWGGIIGWPLFISLAILVGNLWGIGRGEWAGATRQARARLNAGLAVLIFAVILFGLSSALKS